MSFTFKNRLIIFVGLSFLLLNVYSHAGGGVDSSGGGDGVVCFLTTDSASQYLNSNGTLNDKGRERLHVEPTPAVYALDYYRVKDSKKLPNIDKDSHYLEIYQKILRNFSGVPRFLQDLKIFSNQLRSIGEYGIPSISGLLDLNDSERIQNLPQNCIEVQAVLRTGSEIDYDPDLWALMDNFNKAVLQAHEALYYLAKEKREHPSSRKTSVLLGYLLTSPEIWQGDWGADHYYYRAMELKEKIASLDFGAYEDVSGNYAHQMVLKGIIRRVEDNLKEIERIPTERDRQSLASILTPSIHGIVDRLSMAPDESIALELKRMTVLVRTYTDGYDYLATHDLVKSELQKLGQDLDAFALEGFFSYLKD